MSAAHRLLAALLVAAALTACGAGESESKAPMKVEDTAFGDLVGTQEKARAVEDTTMQHKQDMDRAMDDAESAR